MKKVKVNILASIFLQVVTIISGFVLPQIVLTYFGSDTNGLISSINQFLSYVALLEGGIGSVIMAILYKPLYDRNQKKVSQIINATLHFFKTLSLIYIVYAVGLSVVYPLLVSTGLEYEYCVLLIWILAINLFFQYFLSVSYRLLLNADRKVAFVSIIQATIILLNLVGIIICIQFFKDIVTIKLLSAVVFLIQPIVYYWYVKKHYCINRDDGLDEYTVQHRWDGFGINTAYFIHANTDIVVLTIFASLSDVSVYAVYLLIVKALKNLVTSISSAITPSLGNVLASGDRESINRVFSKYEYGIGIITTFLFTCGMILITPFVDVYTLGITDANYHRQFFGILLVLSEMIYCYRDPYVSASYAAGHIKQVTKYAYIEAVLNIVISIVLVNKYGLIGVAIGTTIAMLYRTLMQVFYLRNHIMYRSIKIFVKNMTINMITICLALIICFFLLDFGVSSYFEWFILAIKVSALISVIMLIINMLLSRRDFGSLLKEIKK